MSKARVESRFFTLLFYLIVICNPLIGQNITKKVTVVSGGSVSFIFSKEVDYSSGKTYNNWTRLKVFFLDTIPGPADGASTGFELLVRANSVNILSDDGSTNLPLSTIKITPATTILGATTNAITLTGSDQTLVTGPDPLASFIQGEITITYECGTVTSLLTRDKDYYSVDLVFTIKELP